MRPSGTARSLMSSLKPCFSDSVLIIQGSIASVVKMVNRPAIKGVGGYYSYETTIGSWTDTITNIQSPGCAAPDWEKYMTGLQSLVKVLSLHPAMEPSRGSKCYLPAVNKGYAFRKGVPIRYSRAISKNAIFCMWNFTQRTLVCQYLS